MPRISNLPDTLRPYECHGLQLTWQEGVKEALATCPWCGREEKFGINSETGLCGCIVCNDGPENGKVKKGCNLISFLRMLWQRSYDQTTSSEYETLAVDRKLSTETLLNWQLAKSIINNRWIVPGGNVQGTMTGLYQYVWNGKRNFWLPTPTLGHHLLGMNLYQGRDKICLLEGIWDSASLWEALSVTKDTEAGYATTGNTGSSLLSEMDVVGMAGCQTFNEGWLPLFSGKVVYLLGQNDHEKVLCAKCKRSQSIVDYEAEGSCPHCNCTEIMPSKIAPASFGGVQRIARLMHQYREPPLELHYLKWGDDGWSRELKSGYDVRDLLTA